MEQEAQGTEASQAGGATTGRLGFPQLRLSKAAEYIKRAAQQGERHSPQTLGDYMGHSTASGGAFRTKMAALRDYGLITGTGNQLTISADGILLANADDDAQEQEVLARVFLQAEAFRRVHSGVAKNTPLPLKTIGNRAVMDYGVPQAAKAKFAAAFVESAVDAGLAEVKGDSIVIRTTAGPSPGSDSETPPSGQLDAEGETNEPHSLPTPAGGQPVVLNQSWPFSAGSIHLVIRSSRALPARAYAEIAAVVEAAVRLSALLDSDKPQPAAPSPPDLDAADEELG